LEFLLLDAQLECIKAEENLGFFYSL